VPARLQDKQAPVQALLQQTPSTQKPESHSVDALQENPAFFRPQLPETHLRPVTQSASVVQLARQVVEPTVHEYGSQTIVVPDTQLPVPSQTRMPSSSESLQVPAPQVVPAGKSRQAPRPSHVPSKPQLVGSSATQSLALVAWTPSGMLVQMPSDVDRLHEMQVPSQADSQQTPSTQKLLLHSDEHVQTSPLSLFRPIPPSLVQDTGRSVVDPSPAAPPAPPVPPSLGLSEPGVEEQPTTNSPTNNPAQAKLARRLITFLPHSSICPPNP
jgi:hypothetical protein